MSSLLRQPTLFLAKPLAKTLSRTEPAVVPLIESPIFLIRGQKVLLDADLATLYEVETKALNRAVKRNRDRFPEDFMFQLTAALATRPRC